jgi:Ketopantoate reductase PanE/ApbA
MGKRIGVGAVGGYTGAHMVRAGEDVTFIDMWPAHVDVSRPSSSRRVNPGCFCPKARTVRLVQVVHRRDPRAAQRPPRVWRSGAREVQGKRLCATPLRIHVRNQALSRTPVCEGSWWCTRAPAHHPRASPRDANQTDKGGISGSRVFHCFNLRVPHLILAVREPDCRSRTGNKGSIGTIP